MAIRRRWDLQIALQSWPLQLGFHFDHTDPSLTLHLPFVIIAFGRLKQPGLLGFALRSRRPDEER